jgi:HD-like signal output (HDOD) protein
LIQAIEKDADKVVIMASLSKTCHRDAAETGYKPDEADCVLALLREFSIPEPDLDRIVQLIGEEPQLAAEVLRRGNSDMPADDNPTLDIFEAITRIGMLEARSAVLAFSNQRERTTLSDLRF